MKPPESAEGFSSTVSRISGLSPVDRGISAVRRWLKFG
jgi:hypothetical protein